MILTESGAVECSSLLQQNEELMMKQWQEKSSIIFCYLLTWVWTPPRSPADLLSPCTEWLSQLSKKINWSNECVEQLPWQCWPGEDVGLVEEEEVDWDLLSFLQPAEWWGLLDTGVLTPPLGDWSWAGVTLGGSLGLAGAGDLGTDWGTLLTLLLWEAACLAHRFGSDCLEVLSVWNNNFKWLITKLKN